MRKDYTIKDLAGGVEDGIYSISLTHTTPPVLFKGGTKMNKREDKMQINFIKQNRGIIKKRIFKCEFCTRLYPLFMRNKHHIIFKSLGGSNKNKNKAYLCPNCHTFIHRWYGESEMLDGYIRSFHDDYGKEYYNHLKIIKNTIGDSYER